MNRRFSEMSYECTCHLEKFFGVASSYDDRNPDAWCVIDAECETVCECKREDYAQLIVSALNRMGLGDTACVLHDLDGKP